MDDNNQNQTDDIKQEEPIQAPSDSPVDEAPVVTPDVIDDNQTPQEEAITEEAAPSVEETPVAETEKSEEAEKETEEAPSEPESEKTKEEDTTLASTMEEKPINTNPNAKWYIVHTYSGHENKVAKSLKQRVQSLGFEDRIFDIIVPTRNTIKVSQGKKESVKEKIFPGYVLVKMVLDDESWLLVRTTQGVTAFIGAGNKPTPISEKEVEAIQKFMNAEEPLYKAAFSVGEAVKITDGPFNDFLGTIDNIDEARGKLKVLVSIFGRETPVELDFLQVKKL